MVLLAVAGILFLREFLDQRVKQPSDIAGIGGARLEAVASFGKTRPVVQTPGPEEKNRRTVTEVSGFVKGHPTLLNGKYAEVIMRGYLAGGEAGGEGEATAPAAP